MFSKHVNSKGWHAWNTTFKNTSDIHHMYGVTNVKRRVLLIDSASHIITPCFTYYYTMQCTIDK